MQHKIFETELAGRKLTAEFGRYAGQANGAVLMRYGDTMLLATATMATQPKEGVDFLPLSVEYDERFYAAGRIKGSRWIKREGRPADEAILSGRLIDRTIRPLFPKRLRNEIQVVITVLSFDGVNDPDVLAIWGTSLALISSDIPWNGPVGAVRVAGTNDGSIIINPTYDERNQARFEMITSGPQDLVNMIEMAGSEIRDDELERAFASSQEAFKEIFGFYQKIEAELNPQKRTDFLTAMPADILRRARELCSKELKTLLNSPNLEKASWKMQIDELKERVVETITKEFGNVARAQKEADEAFEEILDELLKKQILGGGLRPDGRKLDELRELRFAAGVLPRVHGSGLFERGETQALSVLTLGAPGLEQYLETMEIVGRKRFMHHYNFPSFSTGETKPMRGPGRREIGHGALVERALEPVLPSKETFLYAVRVVSEILSSNGSTSMAAATASSLALMDGGIPISRPVSGISIGMIMDEQSGAWKLLTDIQGPEDHHGAMDFKVAGTSEGVTAIQMDVKTRGMNLEQFRSTLAAAKKARLQILGEMSKILDRPRPQLSEHAPRILVVKIKPERIKDVIGPGGSMIHRITAQTGAAIEVEDSGDVYITAASSLEAEKAKTWIEGLTREYELGEVMTGKVIKLLDFGAVIELPGGKEGLLHISELAPWRVERVEDVVKLGEEIQVKIVRIENGKLGLSIKDLRYPNLAERQQGVRSRPGSRREGMPRTRRPYQGERTRRSGAQS